MWYPVNQPQTVESTLLTLIPQWAETNLGVTWYEGTLIPTTIYATAVQDWTLLKEAQEEINQSLEERLDALEASITGG